MNQHSAYHRSILESTLDQDSLNVIISPMRVPFLRYPRIYRISSPPSLHPRSYLFTHGKHLFPDKILDNLPNRLFLVELYFGHLPKTNQSNPLVVGLTQNQSVRLL